MKFNPITYWLVNHFRAFTMAIKEMLNAPFSSLLTIIVVGIAITLPTGLFIILQNIQKLSEVWGHNTSISLYIKANTPESQIKNLVYELHQNPLVAKVEYISPEQGLKDFENWTGLNQLIKQNDANPLPGVLMLTPRIQPVGEEAIQQLFSSLKKLPDIEVSQLDLTWIQRFFYILALGQRLILSMGVIFGIGIILIISNTIRLSLQTKRNEIHVLNLIGASPRFIRRPFLYRGALFGILGSMLAWCVVKLVFHWLEEPIQHLANSYHAEWTIRYLDSAAGTSVLLMGLLMGLISAWVMFRFIRLGELSETK